MRTMNVNQPRVYVGTYAKYNNGSIKGGWLNLPDYATHAEFLAACHKLHRDERDPEFMIQDMEHMPDGFSRCESWIYEEDFNDIIQAYREENVEELRCTIVDYSEKAIAVVGDTRDIKEQLAAMGGRFNARLSCGAGWIFSKRKRDEVEQFLSGAMTEVDKAIAKKKAENKRPAADIMEELEREYRSVWGEDDRMVKHCTGEISGAIRLADGRIVAVDKAKLDTDFCFGYGYGTEYEEAQAAASAARSEEYFRRKNTEDLQRIIDLLKGVDEDQAWYHGKPYLTQHCYSSCGVINHWNVSILNHRGYEDWVEYNKGGCTELTAEETKAVIALFEEELRKRNKRIDAYLKRYGTEKLNIWTYWSEA